MSDKHQRSRLRDKPGNVPVPVTFRIDKKGAEVTAVFLSRSTHPTSGEPFRACYAHVGQHAECALAWARECTRAATPDEYAALLRELRQIYDTDGYALSVHPELAQVVSVPMGAVKRPGKRGSRGEYAYLNHACELDGRGDIAAVLCKAVKLESLLHDSAMYNAHAVDCERCKAVMKRRGVTIEADND